MAQQFDFVVVGGGSAGAVTSPKIRRIPTPTGDGLRSTSPADPGRRALGTPNSAEAAPRTQRHWCRPPAF